MNPSFGFPGPKAVELPERRSFVENCREEVVLFTRRRMLDWKSQVTRVVVIATGSALIFVAWKSVTTWLS
jgi:hypothetical protein